MMNNIIAAIRNEDDFDSALHSGSDIFFELSPDIFTLAYEVKQAHKYNKKVYIHIDLAKGITGDKHGLMYSKELGVDGIISTRTHTIKLAKETGLKTVQRFFVVDSHFVDTTLNAVAASKPDMIEIMPGIVTKVIARLISKLDTPLIAGGLIETPAETHAALSAGAFAVSTGAKELWDM